MKMERNVYKEVQCVPPSEKYEEPEIHTGNYHHSIMFKFVRLKMRLSCHASYHLNTSLMGPSIASVILCNPGIVGKIEIIMSIEINNY